MQYYHCYSSPITPIPITLLSFSRTTTYGASATIFDLAAAYAYGLARNHPFIDGNKRIAFVVAAVFLELNGYSLNAPEEEVVEVVLRLAAGQESQAAIANWLSVRSIEH
ncbi:type II toxin-antitoxin system death-on-curing family toxin [Leptolyngbya boryana CZ1]|uniref:Type II toxin-antitoxin system death-on-curing family toxin n=1 Tax=Leptolyngbya boryana CZ1 TaxID=3060204 RepID=A0AA96WT50_LEPBY|nr:type II toxin-antitoxin system death-on-curing family toxin [Leptolyngbya boryana]WNZ45556.1 type II toxin-antitoxin system death-on-curing family toxin [Leptolyngbya boryana CZ1]